MFDILKRNKKLYGKFLAIISGISGFKQEYSRFYQTKNGYQTTDYGKKIKRFSNRYTAGRCFIIGNGPSLEGKDLEKLKDEIAFASNRIYNIYDKTNWRPTYYVAQDDRFLRSSINSVLTCEAESIFLPYNIEGIQIKDNNNIYRFFVDKTDRYPELPLFSEDASEQIYECYTVTYSLLQLAVYMDFKEIYLLGMDHAYSVEAKADGTVVYNDVKDHFEGTEEVGGNQYLPSTDKSTNAFIAAKKYADAHGIKIYNATRGGKLEVFERVNFDDIVKG